MNRKQLGILLVLVAVLGGAGMIIFNKQKEARSAGNTGLGQKLFSELPVNDITHLRISKGSNEVNVIRKDDGWRVAERQDYPANFPQLSEFLLKVKELKAVQSQPVGPSQLGRLQLAPGQGETAATVVEFKSDGGKTAGTLMLGKMHMSNRRNPSPFGGGADNTWPDGRYVMAGTNSGNVAVVAETFENIEPKPEQWVSKDFIRIDKPKSIALEFPDETNSWKIARASESDEWKLADPKGEEKLDTSKASGVTYALSSPSFTDVHPGDEVSGATNRPTVAKFETFDGMIYTVRIGEKTNDAYALTVSVSADLKSERTPGQNESAEDKAKLDEEFKARQEELQGRVKKEQVYQGWTYYVSTWTVDPLLKPRSELLEGKEAAAETGEATSAGGPELENPALPGAASHPEGNHAH